ncbi:hypothetical protein WH47_03518 [Habropoda laboriosa]|uniref:Uncharacterized protein n=1 Tax=Habropoda laboriosa TaxID=597456 RepID=A0A0L7RC50_9HYME|nr:hypothetical protein WH47_03518 [Habropoda laboriosa]
MQKEAANEEETNGKNGILKRWQSSNAKENKQESATLHDVNSYEAMASGRSVGSPAPEGIEQLSKPKETTESLYKVRCDKNSGDFTMRFKSSPFPRRGCSKNCTGINRDLDNSSFTLTMCTSSKRDKLANRIKRSKKKLQQLSDQVKTRTKKSMKQVKKMYQNMGAKRAVGYECDLQKCPSTLMDCSETPCVKPNMLFSKFHKLKEKIMNSKDEAPRRVRNVEIRGEGTKELKVLKDQSVGTNADKETST